LIDRPEGGERAILVHLHLRDPFETADFQEFQELALSAGADIVGTATCSRDVPNSKYFIGTGKVDEIRALVSDLKADLVLFNNTLNPVQERNLEREFKCRVIDRTGLILDIFGQRARTYEGKLQVELAQLKHHSTRLIRGWTHLERQKGGIGLRGGPGETQLETDRRLIRNRIKDITLRLEKVRSQRGQSRRARHRALLPTIALVGYTNAGKSTLFNALTGAHAWVANQLFATLDPTLRALEVPPLGKVVFADTVGFVSKLPHNLVDAFRATLEEVKDAHLLLHIIDSQNETRESRITDVEEVLEQIEALEVPRIEVYNKIDLLPDIAPRIERDADGLVRRIFVSAHTKAGLELIIEAIVEQLGKDLLQGELRLMPSQGRIRAQLYEMGAVLAEMQEEADSILKIAVSEARWHKLCLLDPNLKENWKDIKNE
jgi:GTP-binding protein HflX